jgi:hypothetical protein
MIQGLIPPGFVCGMLVAQQESRSRQGAASAVNVGVSVKGETIR